MKKLELGFETPNELGRKYEDLDKWFRDSWDDCYLAKGLNVKIWETRPHEQNARKRDPILYVVFEGSEEDLYKIFRRYYSREKETPDFKRRFKRFLVNYK